MARIKLILATCRRCGKPVTTTSRSLLGLDAIKARRGILCQGCITEEERYQLLQEQGEAIAKRGVR